MSFSRYAAIVKNLRGVMLFNMDEEGVEASIHWLVKRFRYRNLGLHQLCWSSTKVDYPGICMETHSESLFHPYQL
ncbi:MAG: hypothetical protein QW721_03740 [Desulfurococcaceae archaeon]